MGTRQLALAIVAASVVLAACSTEAPSASTSSAAPTIAPPSTAGGPLPERVGTTEPARVALSIVKESGALSVFTAAIQAAGMASAFSTPDPITVFAPTDAAFAALPNGLGPKLLLPANKEALVKIISYHVITGALPASKLTTGSQLTLEGSTITFSSSAKTGVKVNDAVVLASDLQASNGVVHVIDKVLIPADVDVAGL
jgi:uncharacterized surface protein with fasciclin (FAS1) repeats